MAHSIPVLDLSFKAAADYSSSQYYLMYQSAADTVTKAATAGTKVIGVLQDDPAAAGRAGSVRVMGVTKVVAGAAISVDDELTVDSSGRAVTNSSDSYYIWGRALEAATTAGDIISALVTVGGSGYSGQTVAADGFINIPLNSLLEISSNDIAALSDTEATATITSGGYLASNTTPTLKRVNTSTDKALRITWAASDVTELAVPPIAYPPVLDPANDVTVHIYAGMAGSTNTPTIDIQAWEGVGDTEMGGATAALAATAAEKTVTLSAANLTGSPGFLNLQLVPAAHGTDAIYLYAMWLEYTRK